MKILIVSNAPWQPTGYGKQTKAIVELLQEQSHEVAVLGISGLLGGALNWRDVTVYPAREDPLGMDIVGRYADHFGADVVMTLYDVWAFPPDARQRINRPWIAIIPVDGAPVSERMLQRIRTADWPVAFSLFGKYELWQAGIEADYIPLGIDCETFGPGDRAEARARLCIPENRWMAAMVATNKGFPARKSWPEALAAFARFHERWPDALLYLHTTRRPFGSSGSGIYFDDLLDAVGLPREAVAFVDEGELAVGIPDAQVADVYRAADVLLMPSMGEGFGLPVLEAQACGCPVIAQDCSAMSELVKNGVLVQPLQPLWIPALQYWWQLASVDRVEMALDEVRGWTPEQGAALAQEGVRFAQDYDWPAVARDYWEPFMAKVEAELW